MRRLTQFLLIAALLSLAFAASAHAAGFGVQGFDTQFNADAGGTPLTQAGGHPYSISTELNFNTRNKTLPLFGEGPWPVEPTKDVLTETPVGLVGNPAGAAKCRMDQLAVDFTVANFPICPPASQIGVARLLLPAGSSPIPVSESIYNMVPPPNAPARFAFNAFGVVVTIDASVRSGSDYGVSLNVRNNSEGLALDGAQLTFWGVPADPSHDNERACVGSGPPQLGGPTCTTDASRVAFLRLPTSCPANPEEGLPFTTHIDSWWHPGRYTPEGEPDLSDPSWQSASFLTHLPPGLPEAEFPGLPSSEWGHPQGVTGCENVPFAPEVLIQPTTTVPDSPAGLKVVLSMPQSLDPSTIGEADLRNTSITLPEGMTVNPSLANGLQACTSAQIALHSTSEPTCPDASKLGSVEIETPLLERSLKGNVYLAAQNDNPFDSLLAFYLVVKGPGVILKLPAKVTLDAATGRLTTTVSNSPQLPFSKLTVQLAGGSGAALVTPSTCGAHPIESALEGWNGKSVTISNPYTVECTAGLGGFSPSFVAGTTNPLAGAFSPLVMSFGRNDGEQRISSLSETLPPGLEAKLAGIPLCPDASAAAGSCPASSEIGTVTVAAGAGPDPYFVGGHVYLTGPYNGGPFGEVVVVPALAGPFNLGNVVVRGSIRIDLHTAQATIVSDPFPLFVNQTGIPADVRHVEVTLDREKFTFNPTNCNTLAVTGTLTSTQGASAAVSSRFQAAECRSLAFHPVFKVSSNAKTSRQKGASLHVVVRSSEGQANIAKADVQVPTAFSVRDSTLNLACSEAQFAKDPAGCPQGAFVGTATIRTPILASPLTGPAIFVSHGGAEFPDLDIVLQGEGITVVLTGKTFVKGGHLLSRFDTVPDAPFSRFDLTLPEGPHSALAANGNLCTRLVGKRRVRRVLTMPTTLTGQNGAVLRQSTHVSVGGCPKAKRARNSSRSRK